MSLITDLQTAIDSNGAAIKEYAARLAEDSLNPKKSYSLDGETLDRDKWRATLAKQITDLTQANVALLTLINSQQPYVISTRIIV